ncbi:putative porin, partial [Campylobacter jejuni]
PDVVRQQIKDELRQEVMAQASSEGWVTKEGAAPEWTRRITVFGDVRIRSQSDFYSKTNSTGILDLAAMNAAGPIDLTKATSYQFL